MVLLLFSTLTLRAGESMAMPAGRIIKTMPLLLDTKGHDAVSPSLFDRDAYQAYLREHTNEVSALRFDILWQVRKPTTGNWKLRLELRGVEVDGAPQLRTFETAIKAPSLRHWDAITLNGADYQRFGQIVAWRSTLWHDDIQISEQKSFLW